MYLCKHFGVPAMWKREMKDLSQIEDTVNDKEVKIFSGNLAQHDNFAFFLCDLFVPRLT